MKKIEEYVRSIPDFPEPGIIFRDVTSILQDPDGLKLSIDLIQEKLEGLDFDVIAGTESRGFIFGVPVAYNMHKAFVPVRKRESFRVRPYPESMHWSTGQRRSRFTRMQSSRDRRSL